MRGLWSGLGWESFGGLGGKILGVDSGVRGAAVAEAAAEAAARSGSGVHPPGPMRPPCTHIDEHIVRATARKRRWAPIILAVRGWYWAGG